MGNFIVSGGAGFIGSEFVRQLSQEGHRVIVLDSLAYSGDLARLPKENGFKLIQADINDIDFFTQEILEYFNDSSEKFLVNFAAESHVDRSVSNARTFYMTNVLGTQALLEFATKNAFTKFVQVSTDEVYGSLQIGEATEKSALNPASAYSASKASADLAVLAHSQTHGLNVSISRASNTYGSYQFPEKLIPRAIVLALSGKPIEIYGNGQQVREWISVSDHARGIMKICELGQKGSIYNLGSGVRMSNLNLIMELVNLLGLRGVNARIEFVSDRPGHDFRYAIDSSKSNNELSWISRGIDSFDLGETIQWYLNNENWWKKFLPGTDRISYF